jgi:hypothetical protein
MLMDGFGGKVLVQSLGLIFLDRRKTYVLAFMGLGGSENIR